MRIYYAARLVKRLAWHVESCRGFPTTAQDWAHGCSLRTWEVETKKKKKKKKKERKKKGKFKVNLSYIMLGQTGLLETLSQKTGGGVGGAFEV
jgi:hypothetical protein